MWLLYSSISEDNQLMNETKVTIMNIQMDTRYPSNHVCLEKHIKSIGMDDLYEKCVHR